MKYQDELEAGKRSRKVEMTIAQQVERYRKKLLDKVKEKFKTLSFSLDLCPIEWYLHSLFNGSYFN